MSNITDEILSSKKADLSPQDELNKAKVKDLNSKLTQRRVIFYWIIIVLTIQNCAVYYLFYKSINDITIAKYTAFSILISGTLLSTYGALKIIVVWLFKDSSYKLDS